jgi:type II secretory pathway pseudopilin PulG
LSFGTASHGVERDLHSRNDVLHGRGLWRAEAGADEGFSLLEVLVAATMLTVGLTALAQLFAMSTRTNSSAKTMTYATLLAQQKMEQLRSLAWATDITVAPESATGGTGLSPSPPDALRRNTLGYVDYVHGAGAVLGTGAVPPAGTVYIRRWSIAQADAANTVVLQVMVTRNRDTENGAPAGSRLPGEVRLVSVKTRKPS